MKRMIKVLLVQDSDGDESVQSLLEGEGVKRFRLTTVKQLKRALTRLKKRGRFDVLLLDLNLLQDEAGQLVAVGEAAAAVPWVPIVVLCDQENEEWAVQAVQAGAQDTIVKSVLTRRLLSRTIHHAIERHRILDELTDLNARMEHLIHLDPLTGLLNRRGLTRALRIERERILRRGGTATAVLIDIDDFKRVNDQFGHAVGDTVLKKIADRILSSLRLTDIAARVGGDEFLILLTEGKKADAENVANRVRLAISETCIETRHQSLKITASMGVAAVSKEAPTVEEMLVRTHAPLREGKSSGKNRVCSSREFIGRQPSGIAKDLICAKTFRVEAQPIFDLGKETLAGVEFFTRGPAGVFENPVDFLRLSAEKNILTRVDYTCYKSCVAAFPPKGAGDICLHVNVFPSTLIDVPVERLLEPLAGLGKPRVCIEISAREYMGDLSNLLAPVKALRKAGLVIAIDDVGFGRTAIESMMILEPEFVKIDRGCVTGAAKDPAKSRTLLRLLRIIASLGAEAIVVGVEQSDDLTFLKANGARLGQGYLLGRPVEPEFVFRLGAASGAVPFQ